MLTNNDVRDGDPSFSPDGKSMAFESFRDGTSEAYRMGIDGSAPTRLTNNTASEDRSTSWSPDGSKIAFHSTRDGNFEIYTMNADGSNQTRLTTNTVQDSLPAWSPDGKRIAFYSTRDANPGEIYTMNAADGSDVQRVTNSPGEDAHPSWSPDGTQIAFHSRRTGGLDIYRQNADGSGPATRLTFTASEFEYFPVWSPDGTRIAYNGTDSVDTSGDVFTINALDGSDLTRVTNAPGFDGRCDWQPIPRSATAPVPPAAGSSPGTATVDASAPGVSRYGVTRSPFAVGGATPTFGTAAAKKHKKGTTFRYTLSEAGTATIVISQRRSGRRKGIRCVAPRRSLRKQGKCTRITRRGTLTRISKQGPNSVGFSGRIGTKALSPGSYSATITATDAAKNTSRPKTISFTVVKR